MEPFYPLIAIAVAVLAFLIGAAELIFLEIKPAAFITWLGGWVFAMSLTFSSSWNSVALMAIAALITLSYSLAIFKLCSKQNKRS
jgi:hypothetical protein